MRKLIILEKCNLKKSELLNLPPKFEGFSGKNKEKMVFFGPVPNGIWSNNPAGS